MERKREKRRERRTRRGWRGIGWTSREVFDKFPVLERVIPAFKGKITWLAGRLEGSWIEGWNDASFCAQVDSYARKRTEGRGSYDDAIFLGWIHDEIRIVYGSFLMVAQREEEKEKEEEEEEEKIKFENFSLQFTP